MERVLLVTLSVMGSAVAIVVLLAALKVGVQIYRERGDRVSLWDDGFDEAHGEYVDALRLQQARAGQPMRDRVLARLGQDDDAA